LRLQIRIFRRPLVEFSNTKLRTSGNYFCLYKHKQTRFSTNFFSNSQIIIFVSKFIRCTERLLLLLVVVVVLVFSPWAGLAGIRAQSCDRYGSGTLHSRQVLRGSLPLLSLPLDIPTLAARCLHLPNNARAPSSERWNYRARNGRQICL
jgi:uncharacterized protein YegP (UPF0339 family)